MFCFAEATGETLAGLLRPGNAGANSIEDHLAALDAAIAQLPAEMAACHHHGGDRNPGHRAMRVPADSAGCSTTLASALRARNVGFSVVAPTGHRGPPSPGVVNDENGWAPALDRHGEVHDRSAVIEVTGLVDLSGWPAGTRLIVRREPLHPGAQTSLFPSLEFRYWGHHTDQPGAPAVLDTDMRADAHIKDDIPSERGTLRQRTCLTGTWEHPP